MLRLNLFCLFYSILLCILTVGWDGMIYNRSGQTFFDHDLLKIYFTFEDQLPLNIYIIYKNYTDKTYWQFVH